MLKDEMDGMSGRRKRGEVQTETGGKRLFGRPDAHFVNKILLEHGHMHSHVLSMA